MTKKSGSFVYVLSRKSDFSKRSHYRTLNEAKEYGLEYIHKKDEVFYRFTKIPFPYLFYVSDSYIVFVNYASVDSNKIPYSVRLNELDVEAKESIKLFEKKFNKIFYYDKDSRTKSRDITQKTKNRNKQKRKELENKKKHYNTYY